MPAGNDGIHGIVPLGWGQQTRVYQQIRQLFERFSAKPRITAG